MTNGYVEDGITAIALTSDSQHLLDCQKGTTVVKWEISETHSVVDKTRAELSLFGVSASCCGLLYSKDSEYYVSQLISQ